MAVQIEVNYSKKLGLPGYSSHQFAITVRKEVTDLSQVEKESSQLYRLLQDSVDREIQETGFVPGLDAQRSSNGNGNGHQGSPVRQEYWQCSPKQRQLIERIVEENQLEGTEVEELARERFNLPVNKLNKLQASGLIEELFATYSGKKLPPRGNGNRVGVR